MDVTNCFSSIWTSESIIVLKGKGKNWQKVFLLVDMLKKLLIREIQRDPEEWKRQVVPWMMVLCV